MTQGYVAQPVPRESVLSTDSRRHSDACVEVADLGSGPAVRDSKNPTGPALTFTATEWAAFTAGVKAGEFDRSTSAGPPAGSPVAAGGAVATPIVGAPGSEED